jgi:hypothetical protein
VSQPVPGLIFAERQRQIHSEHRLPEKDIGREVELLGYAHEYIGNASALIENEADTDNIIRPLIKSAALIVAVVEALRTKGETK